MAWPPPFVTQDDNSCVRCANTFARQCLSVRSHLLSCRSGLSWACHHCDLRSRHGCLAARGQSDTPQFRFVLWVIATDAFKYSITACSGVHARPMKRQLDNCFRWRTPTRLGPSRCRHEKLPLAAANRRNHWTENGLRASNTESCLSIRNAVNTPNHRLMRQVLRGVFPLAQSPPHWVRVGRTVLSFRCGA
jgi:hypothetical protein